MNICGDRLEPGVQTGPCNGPPPSALATRAFVAFAMLAQLNATVNFLTTAQTTVPKKSMQPIVDAQVANLRAHWARAEVRSLDDCTAVLDALHKLPCTTLFDEAVVNDLSQIVASRGSVVTSVGQSGGAAASVKSGSASIMTLYNYFPEHTWTTLLNADTSMGQKGQSVVQVLADIDGIHCNEGTHATATATILIASKMASVTPVQFYKHLCDFKRLLHIKSVAMKKAAAGGVRHSGAYPERGSEFFAMYPDAYESSKPPVDSRLAPDDIDSFRDRNPWRTSSRLLRDSGSATAPKDSPIVPTVSTSSPLEVMMHQFMGAMLQNADYGNARFKRSRPAPMLMLGDGKEADSETDDPPLRLTRPRRAEASAEAAAAAAAPPTVDDMSGSSFRGGC